MELCHRGGVGARGSVAFPVGAVDAGGLMGPPVGREIRRRLQRVGFSQPDRMHAVTCSSSARTDTPRWGSPPPQRIVERYTSGDTDSLIAWDKRRTSFHWGAAACVTISLHPALIEYQ